MKVLHAAIIVALLVGPAYGQEEHMQGYHEESKPKSQVEIQADKAAEKAYKNSLRNIPDAAPVDPWGNARAVGAPKTTPKETAKTASKPAAKTAAKTGANNPKAATTPN